MALGKGLDCSWHNNPILPLINFCALPPQGKRFTFLTLGNFEWID